jgi:glutaredoxin
MGNYLFIESKCKGCEEVIDLIGENNLECEIVDVDENGIRGYIRKDLGTTHFPILATDVRIVSGVDAIKSFLAGTNPSSRTHSNMSEV